jgi:hypothetical protein
MIRITINLLHKIPHNSQLSIVTGYMNVEVLHIVLRAVPPVLRVICDIVSVRDDGWLAVLRPSGTIEVKAVQPDASAVKHFPSVLLVDWLCCVGQVEVQIRCYSTQNVSLTELTKTK